MSEHTHEQAAHVILIVDDNADAAEMLAILIESYGHRVLTAHSGADAVAIANSAAPDVVLLDISMPGMDGFEVCRELRKHHPKGHMCIVAVTGWTSGDKRAQAAAAGFDEYLIKPVQFSVVLRALDDCRKHTSLRAA